MSPIPRGQGWPPRAGKARHRRVAEGDHQVSVVNVIVVAVILGRAGTLAAGGGGKDYLAVQGAGAQTRAASAAGSRTMHKHRRSA